MIEKIIDDTYSLKEDAYEAYQDAYSGILKCVVSSFTTIVSCVEGVVQDNLGDFESEVENYISTVKKLAQEIVSQIEQCA